MPSYNSVFNGNVIVPTDVSYRSFTLTADTQLSWPINGNADGNYAARIMEVTTNSTSFDLFMPPANQTSVGTDALIRNMGANTLTVKDFGGINTICTLTSGQCTYIYITANPTVAGTWGIIAFGTGTSSADATTLAGYGLTAIGVTLNQSSPVTSFSSGITVTTTDRSKLYVWTGGAGTMTLDLASVVGNNWFVQVRNSGTGLLTVACSGSDTFNGSASVGLQQGDSCLIACSGSAFFSVGLGKNTQFNFSQFTKAVTAGTYTLTSSEASNVIQKYTGTLSGDVTIIIPPTVQVYYIQNATDGTIANYSVTISTNTGGSNAVIGSNQQATLICDSSNLVNANTVLAGSTAIGLVNGSVSSPAMYFASEPTTGIYRATAGQFNIGILGTNRFTANASGITINGTGIFSGGVSGGTF
jgi:hypothetical protein